MQILYFDFAAICICLLLCLLYYRYNTIKTWQDRVFELMLICALVSSIGDPLTYIMTNGLSAKFIPLNYFMNILYALIQNLMPPLFYMFNVSIIRKRFDSKENFSSHYAVAIPYMIEAVLIMSTPITHVVLYIKPDGSYERGIGLFLIFLMAIYYFALGIRLVIVQKENMKPLQKVCAVFYASVVIISFIIQYLDTDLFVAQFAMALAMIFIFITLKNPLEFIDPSTKVFNRDGFVAVVEEHIARNRKFAVIGVQIDGIKYVSERYGAENGSSLLSSMAFFLKSIDKNCMVFHISAVSKFAIIVPEQEDTENIIDKIRRRFDEAFYINGAEVSIWAYLSEFDFPEDVRTVQDAVDTMDYVTAQANTTKEQQIVRGSEVILQRKRRERDVAQAMDICIEHESFDVYFQPIKNVHSGKYECAEALVRMRSPELGLVMPAEFIPLAERNGQIIAIGDIVLRKVCRFLHESAIMDKSDIRCVNVNLSGLQCMQAEMGQHLMRIIDQEGIPHSQIIFEITESYASSDWDKLFRNMMELSVRGINFALDDYGTGYSNMANIMKYRYSVVKIDKTMLDAACTGKQAYVLLKYTIEMIKELNMNLLIEGVETEKQLDMVKQLGIDYVQGFYFSKPLCTDDFVKFLKGDN